MPDTATATHRSLSLSLSLSRMRAMAAVLIAILTLLLLPAAAPAASEALEIHATAARGIAPLEVTFETNAAPGSEHRWDFGATGATADSASATHTYTSPGVYAVTVSVLDAGGTTQTASATIIADEASPACVRARSDVFAGAELDLSRWEVIRRDDDHMWVGGGALHIDTTQTDAYGVGVAGLPRYPDRNANPPLTSNVVVQSAPAGDWTATTTLTAVLRDHYQQAGLLLQSGDGTGDDNYIKMVFEARGTASAQDRTFQFMSETAGHPGEAGSNTAPVGAAYPDTVHLRLTKVGDSITAQHSPDGIAWTDTGRTLSAAHIRNPQIGFTSFADTYDDPPVVDAAFHHFTITPDGPAAADDFSGSALSTAGDCARWTVVRPDATGMRVAAGSLEIDTSAADIYNADNTGPTNLVMQATPGPDFTAQTFIDGSAFNQGYHNGGLMVYGDDGNYVKLDYVTDGPGAGRLELRAEAADRVLGEQVGTPVTQGRWHLRLTKSGPSFQGWYSADGQTWTLLSNLGQDRVIQPLLDDARVGLFAYGGSAITQKKTAKFDYFRLTAE